MVNVVQPYDMPTRTQNKAENLRKPVKMWCGYVNIIGVEKQ